MDNTCRLLCDLGRKPFTISDDSCEFVCSLCFKQIQIFIQNTVFFMFTNSIDVWKYIFSVSLKNFKQRK